MVHAPAPGRRLLAALVALLALAVACGWPVPVEAAEGAEAAPPSSWPLFVAAGVQVVVALVVGGYQTTRTRLIALADRRLEDAEKGFNARMVGMSTRIRELEALVAETREDFARKTEVEAVRAEIGKLNVGLARVEAGLEKVIELLSSRGKHG